MSKVFDMMYFILLLVKLKFDGFLEGVLLLMYFFFEEFKGRIKLGIVVSEWKEIKLGCF